MLLKKDYEGGLLATLIQDQEQMRNHDSKFHSSFAETFSTASVKTGKARSEHIQSGFSQEQT